MIIHFEALSKAHTTSLVWNHLVYIEVNLLWCHRASWLNSLAWISFHHPAHKKTKIHTKEKTHFQQTRFTTKVKTLIW